MKHLITFILLLTSITTHAAQLRVEGPPAFQQRIAEALALLRDRAPRHYACFASSRLSVIEYSPRTGTAAIMPTTGQMWVGTQIGMHHSIYRLAGTLVHECHHRYHHVRHPSLRQGAGLPTWKQRLIDESAASRASADAYRAMGAPQASINWRENLDGDHTLTAAMRRTVGRASYHEITSGVPAPLLRRMGWDDPAAVAAMQQRVAAKAGAKPDSRGVWTRQADSQRPRIGQLIRSLFVE